MESTMCLDDGVDYSATALPLLFSSFFLVIIHKRRLNFRQKEECMQLHISVFMCVLFCLHQCLLVCARS